MFSFSFFFTAAHFHLALVAVRRTRISHFLIAATKFPCCSSNKKSPLFFISHYRYQLPFFSLSFAGLPPTFSFSLSFCFSIFRVRTGCEVSDPRQITYGVPQGSILGPALFNIFINDLPAVPNLCSLKSYVDDSQLYLSFPVQETAMAVEHLSEDLQRIATWCCTHSFLINPDKTKLLLLGTPQMLARVPGSYATRKRDSAVSF